MAGDVLLARATLIVPPIRNRIRHWRTEHGGLTQQQLAERCAVTRQTIIALEAGKYAPSLDLAFRLSRALRCALEEVFEFDEKI